MSGRKLIFGLFLVVALQVTLSRNAFAYLDPATGSYVFQVLVATVIGGLYAIKTYWHKIRNFFADHFSKKQEK